MTKIPSKLLELIFIEYKLRTLASTFLSNATANKIPAPAISPKSIQSTPSPSTHNTVPLVLQGQMERSIFGIRMPSTVSKGTLRSAALLPQRPFHAMATSSPTPYHTTGVKATRVTSLITPSRSSSIPSLVMNASPGPVVRPSDRV